MSGVKKHPNTLVLSSKTGFERNDNRSPYGRIRKVKKLYFKVSHKTLANDHPKEQIIGIVVGDITRS